MASLDTNVLVRFLVQDDALQSDAARRLIEEAVADGRTLHVPVTVILELEWVLRSAYAFGKDVVLQVLASLFSSAELAFESEQALEVALQLYRDAAADFADCVHIALAAQTGELPLMTFDRKAAKVHGAALVSRQG